MVCETHGQVEMYLNITFTTMPCANDKITMGACDDIIHSAWKGIS